MEQGSQNKHSFHLAGVVPVAGQKLDFNFPWHDSLQPIAPDFLAIERAIWECAHAGCNTIWIVCYDDQQPLIKHRIGEWVHDPIYYYNEYENFPTDSRREIPIYYVPMRVNDLKRRDCLGWSVLYGAQTAYWLSRNLSKWVIPDRYYVAFPYGVYGTKIVRENRGNIASKKGFFFSHRGKTVQDGEYLGFTFDGEDFIKCRRYVREQNTKLHDEDGNKRPIEERWSARLFPLDIVFKCVRIEDDTEFKELEWYYNIDNWDKYCNYISSKERKLVSKPHKKLFGANKKWHLIGVDDE